ncbi:hypothetical protein RUM44_002403 [Polyplax serrata]|uniref:Uncharacterized protein n=1 Tax=Polyplax serrata TaxID=468196 RepID=A0ABR1AEP5_POLSC
MYSEAKRFGIVEWAPKYTGHLLVEFMEFGKGRQGGVCHIKRLKKCFLRLQASYLVRTEKVKVKDEIEPVINGDLVDTTVVKCEIRYVLGALYTACTRDSKYGRLGTLDFSNRNK